MGIGLVRSLQPPDILWFTVITNWRVYNSIANTSEGVLFLPPSDVYVRSFLYLLYFNTTLLHKSSERSSLVSGPGLNSSLEAKSPGVFRGSATTCQFWSGVKRRTNVKSVLNTVFEHIGEQQTNSKLFLIDLGFCKISSEAIWSYFGDSIKLSQ